MQDRPICFGCAEVIHNDWVYESPCGHDECPSVVWHGIHLMEHREHREKAERAFLEFLEMHRAHLQERHDQEGT